jgi:SOS response regulatory protein OraA/RecX
VLTWEEDPWKKVYKSLFLGKLRSLFSAENLQDADRIFLELEEKISKSFAVNSLSKRPLLGVELLKKLRERGISELTAHKTLAFCQKIGAIQDQELLELRIARELAKGHGLRYIQAKWKLTLNGAEKKEAEKDALIKFLNKKGKKQKNLYQILLRRGFCLETIQEVLRDFF